MGGSCQKSKASHVFVPYRLTLTCFKKMATLMMCLKDKSLEFISSSKVGNRRNKMLPLRVELKSFLDADQRRQSTGQSLVVKFH